MSRGANLRSAKFTQKHARHTRVALKRGHVTIRTSSRETSWNLTEYLLFTYDSKYEALERYV